MDLADDKVPLLFSPAAAFTSSLPEVQNVLDWTVSSLNPKNRVDSLSTDFNHQWKFAGCTFRGDQFFVTPEFASGKAPKRIDLYLSEQYLLPAGLHVILSRKEAMVLRDSRIQDLSITQYLSEVLQHWAAKQPNFKTAYENLPFGSSILIERLSQRPGDSTIRFVPAYQLEQKMLTIGELANLWQIEKDKMPPTIDLTELQFQNQLHESITLVRISLTGSIANFVFKSSTTDLRYLYHELKVLLTIRRHDNIIAPPLYLVTNKCLFGGRAAVCGFILEYHNCGNLRDCLQREGFGVPLKTRLRWVLDILSALIHISESPAGFYSDLRTENVVLSGQGTKARAILIDLENRGNWPSWSPPEVYYLRTLALLNSSQVPLEEKKSFQGYLEKHGRLLADFHGRERYSNPELGYCATWLAIPTSDREAAQVYSFGKLLWCILECKASVHNNIGVDIPCVDGEFQMFPEFRNTPPQIRQCIVSCTAGAPEWRKRWPAVLRKGSLLYPRSEDISVTGEWSIGSGEDTQAAARTWWRDELDELREFLDVREARIRGSEIDTRHALFADIQRRPKLSQIDKEIRRWMHSV